MIEQDDLRVGMTVTYVPRRISMGSLNNYKDREVGKVTSWNELCVFVDYSNSGRGIATNPNDLIKGDYSFYCENENNSVTDGAFGRCSKQCNNCKPVKF